MCTGKNTNQNLMVVGVVQVDLLPPAIAATCPGCSTSPAAVACASRCFRRASAQVPDAGSLFLQVA